MLEEKHGPELHQVNLRLANVTDREAKDDLFYGQVVIIVARWFLIAAGIGVAVWSARSIADVTLPIVAMAVLTTMNFFLHGRYLMSQPVNARLVYLSSAIDLMVITFVVGVWEQGGGSGLKSSFFVFLYPTLFAFGLVFPRKIALTYAAVTILAYVAVVLLASGVGDLGAQKDLAERVITLAAAAGLGTFFWRIERDRRRAASTLPADLIEQVKAMTEPLRAS